MLPVSVASNIEALVAAKGVPFKVILRLLPLQGCHTLRSGSLHAVMAARLAKQLAALAKGFSCAATKTSTANQLAELAHDCATATVPAFLAGAHAELADKEHAELARWVGRKGTEG